MTTHGAPPLQTSLFDWHKAHGGRIVEFGGWAMPVQYTTIVDEHNTVRNSVGLFDIGHMGRLSFSGDGALDWLEHVTTNHVAKLVPGQIQYSLMVNDDGGVIDDILVYRTGDSYSMVCNASNRLKVIAQLEVHRHKFDAMVNDLTPTTAMIAVQGPRALATAQAIVDINLGDISYYYATACTILGQPGLVSRTGYTGEDGVELIVPSDGADALWNALLSSGHSWGIKPCGLGARDTLRFEAGMPLYGHEMDETVDPYSAGLGWAIKLKKGHFVGRDALRIAKDDTTKTRVGLRLNSKRIARQGCEVKLDGKPVGVVTSGTFAPTLGETLAMAIVTKSAHQVGTNLTVDVRGTEIPATVVPLPFYRRPAIA